MKRILAGWEIDGEVRGRLEHNWKRLGIKNATVRRYQFLLDKQGGVCALCGTEPVSKRLALDHNHETGEVRGLLCYRCNYQVGIVETFCKLVGGKERVFTYIDSKAEMGPQDVKELGNRPYIEERRRHIAAKVAEYQSQHPFLSFPDVIAEVAQKYGKSETTIKRYLGML